MAWGSPQWVGSWAGSWSWPFGGPSAAGAEMMVSVELAPGGASGGSAVVAAGAVAVISVSVSGPAQGYSTMALAKSLAASWRQKGRQLMMMDASPTISGVASAGSTLTASPGRFGATAKSIKYQWHVGRSPVPGATAPTFRVREADVGRVIECGVVMELGDGPMPTMARHS